MTFEEFRKLAVNPPRREEPILFEVIRYGVVAPGEDDRPPHERLYVRTLRVGFGRTLEEAEKIMRQSIDEAEDEYDDIYAFHIKEFPVGVCMNDSFPDLGVSTRLYDNDGYLLDRTFCSDLHRDHGTEFGIFRGRGPEQQRFREGDIVEMFDDDHIRLVEVGGTGPSIERCWEIREGIKTEPRFQKKDGTPLTEEEIDRRYCLDWSDDQVTVYYDDFPEDDDETVCRGGDHFRDHEHVSPLFLRHRTGILDACFMNPNKDYSEEINN